MSKAWSLIACNWNTSTETVQVTRKKGDIIKDLLKEGRAIPQDPVSKNNVIKLSEKFNITTKKTVEKGVTETWLGNIKWVIQVVYEWLLLNLEKYPISAFKEKGPEIDAGNIDLEASLEFLLNSCTNFIQEETMLHMNIRMMGGICFHSPKYHCGIAAELIKYSWDNSKYINQHIKAVSF